MEFFFFFAKHSTDNFSLNENGMTLIEPKMFPGRVGDQVTRPWVRNFVGNDVS